MQRRKMIGVAAAGGLFGCSHVRGTESIDGFIVEYNLLPGAAAKLGIMAVSNTGRIVFSPSSIRQRTATSFGNGRGVQSYSGVLPQWVHVTWRTGEFEMDFKRGGWTGGTIVGDYRIEVAPRIPRDVIDYALALRGRALRLIFWLKDDGVLLAWDVQEPPGFGIPIFVMHGGDFVEPKVYNGKLVTPGWYIGPDGRRIIID